MSDVPLEDKKLNNRLRFEVFYKVSLLVVLLVSVVIFSFSLKGFVRDGSVCAQNPYVYGSQKLVDHYGVGSSVSCSCLVNVIRSPKVSFCFDENSVRVSDCPVGLSYGVQPSSGVDFNLLSNNTPS